MLSPLAGLGVATLCFYIPTTLACVLLCFRQRKSPLPAVWFLLVASCLVRFAGAVSSILVPHGDSGVIIAAFALLSTGGLLLVLTMILLLSVVRIECPDSIAYRYSIFGLRLLFIISLALRIAGIPTYAQPDSPTIVHIGQRLAEAAPLVSILLLAVCFLGEMYVWVKHRKGLLFKSRRILTGNMMVKTFLVLRLSYFCLDTFTVDSAHARWNPLTGSMATLVCMALLPEFITLLIYAWVGFTIDFAGCSGSSDQCHAVGGARKIDVEGA